MNFSFTRNHLHRTKIPMPTPPVQKHERQRRSQILSRNGWKFDSRGGQMIKPRTTVNTQAGSSVPCERRVRSNLSAGWKFVRCPENESLKTIPVHGMKFLWEFIFADWRIFCVLRELIFAIRTDWFFSLGKIFAIFRKYPVPSTQYW